ncbi:myomegalin-like isoform X1 [Xyrichtys novacula]|uniref:Myomegalin-like isoform X1 n=1 Tax=Xyrichtys novacula TaxID=13765 RepID=A0AAV1FDK6_XYRNO|nr:myomegalin-like isoform X1 [Xyrichtys novacula]
MSGFLYRGRDCAAQKRARPKSLGPMMDFSRDETEKGPPVQTHSLREFEQHLNDLKKENFSLKLRIYFLEEKIQQKFEESSDDVHKRNIELKVEVESLKNELVEKQQLVDKALSTAESLSNQSEAELQRRLSERQEEICHMQEILQTKVQLLQEEAELARGEAERMASFADSESQRCLALEREMAERMVAGGGSGGPLAQQALADKDRLIEELTQQKHSLDLRVQELEVKVQDLSETEEEEEAESRRCRGDCRVNSQLQIQFGRHFYEVMKAARALTASPSTLTLTADEAAEGEGDTGQRLGQTPVNRTEHPKTSGDSRMFSVFVSARTGGGCSCCCCGEEMLTYRETTSI